jgi:hypothetical protein
VAGTSHFFDQPAVRAAIHGKFPEISCNFPGRLLILEGLEKAERNILPIINNLLENREMQLEDGRLLINHSKYQKLLESHRFSIILIAYS